MRMQPDANPRLERQRLRIHDPDFASAFVADVKLAGPRMNRDSGEEIFCIAAPSRPGSWLWRKMYTLFERRRAVGKAENVKRIRIPAADKNSLSVGAENNAVERALQ